MASTDNNVEHLEREVEQTRAHVSETLDALQTQVAGTVQEWRGRLSYEELSKDAKNYARNSATRMAHERPVLTGAIGLAVAYPFLKLATKIPLPFYLIGAGAYMMKPVLQGGGSESYSGYGSRDYGRYGGDYSQGAYSGQGTSGSGGGEYQPGYGGRSSYSASSAGSRYASAGGSSEGSTGPGSERYVGSGGGMGSQRFSGGGYRYSSAGSQGSFFSDLAQRAQSMLSSFGGGSHSGGGYSRSGYSGGGYSGGGYSGGGSSGGGGGLRSVLGNVSGTASSAVNSATSAVSQAARGAADAATSAAQSAAGYASSAVGGVSSSAMRGASYSRQIAPTNVWVLGGLGLAVGATVAAMLPRTQVENRWVGPTSDEVRRRARELANARMDEARDMMSRAYDVALEEAQNRGLTPDAARQSAQDFVDRIRDAAQRGAGIGGQDSGSGHGGSQQGGSGQGGFGQGGSNQGGGSGQSGFGQG